MACNHGPYRFSLNLDSFTHDGRNYQSSGANWGQELNVKREPFTAILAGRFSSAGLMIDVWETSMSAPERRRYSKYYCNGFAESVI